MRRKCANVYGLFALLALPFPSTAQKTGLPSAEQVLSKYVQALGGRESIQKVSTRVMSGKFEIDGVENGTVEVFYKTPNLYHSVVRVNGYGILDSGHDAKGGWEKSPDQPIRAQSGSDLARSRRELDLRKAVKVAQLYRSVTVKGKGQSGGRAVWLVVAVPAEGYPETMYFDVESGLLLKVDLQLDTENGPVAVERHYQDYRDVGGVKVAHTIRFLNPGLSYTLKFTAVHHNIPIATDKLARPASE